MSYRLSLALRVLVIAAAFAGGCARGNTADPRLQGDAGATKDAVDAPNTPSDVGEVDAGPRCATDDDCRTNPDGALCDPSTGRCGACVVSLSLIHI